MDAPVGILDSSGFTVARAFAEHRRFGASVQLRDPVVGASKEVAQPGAPI